MNKEIGHKVMNFHFSYIYNLKLIHLNELNQYENRLLYDEYVSVCSSGLS